MNFHELAEVILKESDTPLTANEIWQKALIKGITDKLNSKGKTPWASLGAKLYVSARDEPNGKFKSIGRRPKRFYLRNKEYHIDFGEYEKGEPEEELEYNNKKKEIQFLEKDLHPFLNYFAYYYLSCYTKTINHLTSDKKHYGEWLHPDIVGCIFPIEEWDEEILQLSSSIGNTSVKFISFELKKELNLSTLREYFFQTVSNSSWANEGYLVAAKISENEDFLDELSRLSSSFGIGIIRLDIDDPDSSKILYPARAKDNLDWDTINKLTMNKDFKEFVKRIRIDLTSNEIRKEKYDKIYNEKELLKMIKK